MHDGTFITKVSRQPYDKEFVDQVDLQSENICEVLDRLFESWTAISPVLIEAPTGSGKTTFFRNTIIAFCEKYGLQVLFVSNRNAVNEQLKVSLTKGNPEFNKYNEKGILGLSEFGKVTILTYQMLERMLENLRVNDLFSLIRRFHVVVFDEAHFFLSDSTFNSSTQVLLEKAVKFFNNSIRIYMTATANEILPILVNVEKQFTLKQHIYLINNYVEAILHPKRLIYYKFSRKYNYIRPWYFSDFNEITSIIKQDVSDDKWLIFVDSIMKGEEICREIGDTSTMITAKSKNSKGKDGEVFSQLVFNEKFDYKVLVSTCVIDNGVNIKDQMLRNVVVLSYNQTEFIQMLGRKRVVDGEIFNLFLYASSSKDITQKIRQIDTRRKAVEDYKRSKYGFVRKYYEGETEDFEQARGMFYFERRYLRLRYNEYAEIKLNKDYRSLNEVKVQLDAGKKNAYIIKQLSWLGLEHMYNEQNWINYNGLIEHKQSFIKFVSENTGKTMKVDETNEFYSRFQELYTQAYGRRPSDRSDRKYKATIVRDILKELNMKYELVVKDNTLTIIDRSENNNEKSICSP